MSSLAEVFFTPEQYLEQERVSEVRHEYINGQIFAMAGSTPEHNAITVNVTSALHVQSLGRCRVFSSDVRVKIPKTSLYTYPDVAMVCGTVRFDERDASTVTNPKVIVEVLSKSTEGYDRGDKFAHYQLLDSLTDYLLISQDKVRVEHYRRQGDHQWLLTVSEGMEDVVKLDSVNGSLRLAEIYQYIEFPREPEVS